MAPRLKQEERALRRFRSAGGLLAPQQASLARNSRPCQAEPCSRGPTRDGQRCLEQGKGAQKRVGEGRGGMETEKATQERAGQRSTERE